MTEEEYLKRKKLGIKATAISKGYTYKGLVFAIDDRSRNNMVGKLNTILLDPSINTVKWITESKDSKGNDIIYTFTVDEFKQFILAVSVYYENLLFKLKEELKDITV